MESAMVEGEEGNQTEREKWRETLIILSLKKKEKYNEDEARTQGWKKYRCGEI